LTIEIPPAGTHGSTMPKTPRPVAAILHAVYGWFGGQLKIMGRPLIELETVGSRSGLRRNTILGVFPPSEAPPTDATTTAPGGGWLVVASNGGAARHPGWFINLARHPEDVWVHVGRERLRVVPECLSGAEREAAWERVVSMSPGYGKYAGGTDRQIPLIVLRPAR
jgi:deazaflavin-dependent oxidoreductase (nitroreductase family)